MVHDKSDQANGVMTAHRQGARLQPSDRFAPGRSQAVTASIRSKGQGNAPQTDTATKDPGSSWVRLGQIKAGPGSIRQVVMNMAIDARDAMSQ